MIDVRSCGAVGDGVTDDTAAFKKAMAAAQTFPVSRFDGQKHPVPIVVPTPGTYLLSAPLDVYHGFSMQSDCHAPVYQDDQHTAILWNKTGPMFRIPAGLGAQVRDLSWSNLYMVGDRSAYQTKPYPGDVWLAHEKGVQIRGLSITGCRINAFNSLWGIPRLVLGNSVVSGRTGAVAGVHTGPPTIVMARIERNMLGSLCDWNDTTTTTAYPGGSARCAVWLTGSDSWVRDNMLGGMGNGARHPTSNRPIYVLGIALTASAVTGNHIVALSAGHTYIQGADFLQYRCNRHDPGFAAGADGPNMEVYAARNLIIDGNWYLNGANKAVDPMHRAALVLANVQNVELGPNHFHDTAPGASHIEVISNGTANWPTTTRKVAHVHIGHQQSTLPGPVLDDPAIRFTAYNAGTWDDVTSEDGTAP